jgi:alpha-beta hydrolase superfamily lysophospholipase
MRILLVLLAGYFLVVLLAALAQRHMLYFPDTTPPCSDNLRSVYGPTLALWPATGDTSHRGYISAEPSAYPHSRGTVVVFHGNAGSARDRHHYISALEQRGYQVVLAEYPGYGGRDGKPSEATFISDGSETARLALEAFGGPLWIWGESLGAGVAAGVAADKSLPVAGVVLITPWDNLPDLAQALYWYLPVRWLIRDQYDNRVNLEGYTGPVAVLIAERDEIIPLDHGRRLYEALPAPKLQRIFPGAGHNSWPIDPSAMWWDDDSDWLEEKRLPSP